MPTCVQITVTSSVCCCESDRFLYGCFWAKRFGESYWMGAYPVVHCAPSRDVGRQQLERD